jgi:tetratricopeptide (TPR) repeat protein
MTLHELDVQRGMELEAAGEWSEAATYYRKLLNSGPEQAVRVTILLRLATCLLETGKRGQTDEAEDCLSEAQKSVAAVGDKLLQGQLRLVQGRLDEHQGNLKRALARYHEARQLLVDSTAERAWADLMLASAERRRGELKLALERLESIHAEALIGRLRADYYDELGALHLARGDTGKAIETLQHALELDQLAANANEYTAGHSRLLLAEAYLRQGLRPKAKQLIEQAIRTYDREHADAGLSEALALMGLWYEEAEDYVLAARYYKESFDLDRNSDDVVGQARAKRCLGRTFRKKGEFHRAQEFFDEARALLPREDDVEMAALLTEEGHLALGGSGPDYSEAIDRFSRALEIATEDGDERAVAIAQRNLAKARRESNDLGDAERLLREALPALERRGDLRELDDLLDDLGEVLLEQDRYPEALEYIQASLELDVQLGTVDSQGRSHLLLGRTHLQLGERQKAARAFQDALDVYHEAENDVGKSEALRELGSWYAEEGRLNDAIRCFREALAIDNRLDDRIGVVRAKRSLASVYRRRGDLERSAEIVGEAEQDLRRINDPMERALLAVEQGRIALAQGSYREAREHLNAASRVFERSNSQVQIATCRRLLANALVAEGNYARALDLLQQARRVFEAAKDMPELDELYDDLGSVLLLSGRLDEADDAVHRSLEIGRRMGWEAGKGRSLLLLGRIAMRRDDMAQAFMYMEDARTTYAEIHDEVGLSDAYVYIGDWYAHERNADRDFARAASAYKQARRLDQMHRDLRGMGRSNRKLAHVYLLAGEFHRAEEALEQAEDNLRGVDDPREVAPLHLEMGVLHAARTEHREAVRCFRRALVGFKDLSQAEEITRTYQLLITAHQNLGEVREALEYIREMGLEHATMWNVLAKDLHPVVSKPSYPAFSAGAYHDAITAAFAALEREFRARASTLPTPPGPTTPISDVIRLWLSSDDQAVPDFPKKRSLERFADLCVASFDIIRNSAVHGSLRLSASDAFASLAVAHLIATTVRAGEPQVSGGAAHAQW